MALPEMRSFAKIVFDYIGEIVPANCRNLPPSLSSDNYVFFALIYNDRRYSGKVQSFILSTFIAAAHNQAQNHFRSKEAVALFTILVHHYGGAATVVK